MADAEQIRLLERGVDVWNTWRKNNPNAKIDLSDGKIRHAYLVGVDFHSANLNNIRLQNAMLFGANFRNSDLKKADFSGSNLRCSHFINADLAGADLNASDLSGADLANAKLVGASLAGANLSDADLINTDFTFSQMGWTNFGAVNLAKARGLENIRHFGPSSIGIDTLYRSEGKIPEVFLSAIGLTKDAINLARLIRSGPSSQQNSCFISYSTKDDEFARRLYSRMREANIRVWFAPEDLSGGKKLHEQLFEAIQLQEKLLLVLSENSIQSEWVMTEIRKARETEKKRSAANFFQFV